MKVLLVSPARFVANRRQAWTYPLYRMGIHGGDSPPLGLASVAAAAEAGGHVVQLLDLRVETRSREAFEAELSAFAPDVVGLYLTTFNIQECVEVARFVKDRRPAAVTVVGGPNVGIYPVETLRHACFDYGMRGECDETFPRLLASLAAGKPDRETPGLVYRAPDGGIALAEGPAPLVEDIDALPLPAHHLLRGRYRYFGASREPFTSMISSRGCPYDCRFCGKPPGARRARFRSVEPLLEEMRRVRRLGYREVNFFDDLFTLRRDRVMALCDALVAEGLDLAWSVRSRIDSVDEELLARMKDAGCRRIYFGVESGSPRTLERMNKQLKLDTARRVLHLTRRLGLESVCYFIVGYPGETEADLQLTVDFARELETDFCNFNIFDPLPASHVLEDWIHEQQIEDPWKTFLALETERLPYYHGDLDRETVEAYFRKCWRAFYLRPRTWWAILRLVNGPTRFKNFSLAALSMLAGPLLARDWEHKS